jgi:hypothetical protein
MQDYEKLGAFYLGRPFDVSKGAGQDGLILYDSRDLVTHAVCVGMTGSGKTGLCIALLEEGAIDAIPAIVIDPKGDLANLLLTFPQLRAEDFRPWINEDDAARKGMSPDQFAQQQAELWSKGLASWGQDGDRIARLKESADFSIYTPGSNAGLPVSILKSFAAPNQSIRDDAELLQEQVRTTATSLLGLAGVDADPLTSREHILLSSILAHAWKQGQGLDLGALIQQIQQPPLQKVGVIDIESFFPQKDRFALAMRLNNLLAAPGFESWMSGEPLDIAAMLHTSSGKPRISIFSIAHLSDAERMFFVSLLLNQVLGWVRSQSGTTSLRAIVYMDEIFGYFPPTANPPSKTPLLTLLKQARAFGVGIVLATQNPVDLDYKGLANAGTWFIGRLQTERDKARVLDGLEGVASTAGAGFDRQDVDQLLSKLGNRVFLMNNVHDDGPVVFETRWVMSYLRGPLTRPQIKQLMDARKAASADQTAAARGLAEPGVSAPPQAAGAEARSGARPVLPPSVPQVFVPVRSVQPSGASLVYRPMLLGTANVFYVGAKSGADAQRQVAYLAVLPEGVGTLDWQGASETDVPESDLEQSPAAKASFAPVPPAASQPKSYDEWRKSLADTIYRVGKLELLRSPMLKQMSKPGEHERDFRARLQHLAHEQRDEIVDKLRQKYAAKVATLEERKRRAEQNVQVQQQQATASKWSTAMSFGTTILGALLGRRKVSSGNLGRAATSMRGVGRTMKESSDVGRAEETVGAIDQQIADLNAQLKSEVDALHSRFDPTSEPMETIALRPRKTDINIRTLALAWVPFWNGDSGDAPAWQ